VRTCIAFLLLGSLAFAAPAESDLDRAGQLYAHANFTAAARLLDHGAAAHDPRSLALLGQCYYMLGEFKKATETLEKASAAAPSDSMVLTWLGRAWGMRAESAFPLAAIGQAGKSRDAFERALRLDPSNNEALGDLFDFYMAAPGMIGGGLDKAESLLPKYQQYDPVGYHIAKARIEEKKERYPNAENSFRKAVEVVPHRVSLVLELAQYLHRRGRYDESEREFRHAAEIAPESPSVLYARANSYIAAHRNVEQARDLLKKYLASTNLTPDDPPRWEAQKLLRKAEVL